MSDQYKAVAATLGKVFFAACLAQIIASGVGVLDLGADGWKSVVAAGLSALVIAAYNWISPNDTRYGNGYVSQDSAE